MTEDHSTPSQGEQRREGEMIERVGRAIMQARHKRCCATRPLASFPFDPDEARAAIEAMRYPTVEMMDGFMSCNAEPAEAGRERRHWEGDFGQFAASFSAMLDSVLHRTRG